MGNQEDSSSIPSTIPHIGVRPIHISYDPRVYKEVKKVVKDKIIDYSKKL